MADISSNPVVDWGGMITGSQLQAAQTGQAQAQTGLTQANTQLTQQQAQAAAMQNQLLKARLPLIMQALSDYNDNTSDTSGAVGTQQPTSGGSQSNGQPDTSAVLPAAGSSPETSWYKPNTIDAALRSQYFVPPVTPQEAQRIQRAALIGDPGLLDAAKQQRQLRVEQQTAASQYGANNMYDAMQAVSDASPGTALEQLEAVAPNTAKRIRDMIPDEADEDAAARAYAAHVGGAVHQYTGRPVDYRADGTPIDKVTGKPVAGVEKSGLSEQQWADLAKSGNNLVDMNDGQGHIVKVPQWRANGAPSLQAWVMQQAAHGGVWGAQSTISGAPKAAVRSSVQKAVATAQAPDSGPAVAGAPQEGTTTTNGQPDPVMSQALADKEYKFVPPVHAFGTALSKDEQDTKDKQAAAAVSLKEDMDKTIPAAQTAQTFYRAAQDILDSKGASAGRWSGVVSQAASWIPGLNAPIASDYQELAKYLGNAALQAGKQIFPKMTDKASALSLEKLNPAPNMQEPAIRNMLDLGNKMSQYTIDGARRTGAYLRSGGDATRFQSWLNKYWDMPTAVNGQKSSNTSTNQKYSDAQINAWAKAHNVDPVKARTFLLGSK
jgi:hypothetical protein